jgi:hypothetical protein
MGACVCLLLRNASHAKGFIVAKGMQLTLRATFRIIHPAFIGIAAHFDQY